MSMRSAASLPAPAGEGRAARGADDAGGGAHARTPRREAAGGARGRDRARRRGSPRLSASIASPSGRSSVTWGTRARTAASSAAVPAPGRAPPAAATRKSTACAAATSSQATMRAVFCSTSARLARRDRRHRDVVLHAGRGRDRVDRRREALRLVLGHQRGRGVLDDHEPRVEARARGQERGQPARALLVEQQVDAALGDRADLGERGREVVGDQRRPAGRGSSRPR